MSPPPIHIHTVYHCPSLIGVTVDRELVDLDNGLIIFLPSQDVLQSWGGEQNVCERFPRLYSLEFSKSRERDLAWIEWFDKNTNVVFDISHIRFHLTEMNFSPEQVNYKAEGHEIT